MAAFCESRGKKRPSAMDWADRARFLSVLETRLDEYTEWAAKHADGAEAEAAELAALAAAQDAEASEHAEPPAGHSHVGNEDEVPF